ncbi:MAG TPA: RsmD family RNA methyltransferase [Candidatus Saccharimonadales bacterium]|nr:RsmD family RNA methyltransferase [Candidatus Saccharimonadales bacterium]
MRIIAGRLKGRIFSSPSGQRTHPMSDKIRGALFNALGDIAGLTVLDPFAGSGALSFEAISRGAKSALAIDSDPAAQRAIAENMRALGLADAVKLINANANAWLKTSSETFDLVLCDPPYDSLQQDLLEKLAERAKIGGLIIYSLPPKANFALPTNYQPLSTKSYGDAQLVFYRRTSVK